MSPSVSAALQRMLPQRLLGRIVYRASRSRRTRLKNLLIRWFTRRYRVDLDEAAESDPAAYTSFNQFFTRALKPGARRVATDPSLIVSPADGTLTEHGILDGDRLLQAKGMPYTVADLLAEDEASMAAFAGGSFATIYLAPHDYHRVHAPAAGRQSRTRYVPGKRFSVNRATAGEIPRLFCRNERAILWIESDFGTYALVMVGALNVSSIGTVAQGEIASGRARLWDGDDHRVERGAEVGRFNLGSTVVIVFPRGSIALEATLAPGRTLRMGEPIGRISADRA